MKNFLSELDLNLLERVFRGPKLTRDMYIQVGRSRASSPDPHLHGVGLREVAK